MTAPDVSATSSGSLAGKHILIVEDEYLVAEDLAYELGAVGAEIIGPAGSVSAALALINEHDGEIDAASLDINLNGQMVYPIADALLELNIPFVFCTGYDQRAVPAQYQEIARCEKPVESSAVVRSLHDALARVRGNRLGA